MTETLGGSGRVHGRLHDEEGAGSRRPGVVGIAASVRQGEREAREWLEDAWAADRSSDRALHALVQRCGERAMTLAIDCDRRTEKGRLAGVPFSVKECFPVRGLRTTLGIRRRMTCVDSHDATIVVRLLQAGAVLLGKANVPQAMYLHETDNPVWGRTNHPLRSDRGPGGSSGGDAALVAAGVAAAAVGTDLAGSIRQPAHACGVCGLVPTSARLGLAGGFDTMPSLAVVRARAGFLARDVADLEALLEAVATPRPLQPSASIRVGWTIDAGPLPPSPAIVRGVEESVGWLRAAGLETSLLEGALVEEAAWIHLRLLSADGGRDVRRLFEGERPMPAVGRLMRIAGLPRFIRPVLSAFVRLSGRRLDGAALAATGPLGAAAFAEAVAGRDALRERMRTVWRLHSGGCPDALVLPVSALPALRHGAADRLVLAAAPCLLANLLDLPAGTVPVTTVRPGETLRTHSRDPVVRLAAETDIGSEGLPVGVQVVALDGRESTLLRVMRLIEAGRRSAGRSPA
jgi:fatty acid amide hydrolase